MGLGYCGGNKPRFNYSHCFIFIFLRKLHYCHAIITVISAQQMQVVELATRRNQRSNCLPVLGRKIFLLFVDVEGPLNALKILYWLVHGTKRQSVLAIKNVVVIISRIHTCIQSSSLCSLNLSCRHQNGEVSFVPCLVQDYCYMGFSMNLILQLSELMVHIQRVFINILSEMLTLYILNKFKK